jgi:protein SCO1/2
LKRSGWVALAAALAAALLAGPAGAQSGAGPNASSLSAKAAAEQPAQADNADNPDPWQNARQTKTPDAVQGIEITQHLGDTVPLDTKLTTSDGQAVTLGDYFKAGDKPVILNFAYYECPVLCSLIMEGLARSVQDLGWAPGEKYRIVTISIDPGETPKLAGETKKEMLEVLTRNAQGEPIPAMQDAGKAWHFHTASESEVAPLAKAAGFGYRYLPEQDQYVHKPAIIMVSPEGKITRYLTGIQFPASDLRSAIEQAAAGQVGQKQDTSLLMSCIRYIKDTGWVSEARGIMRLGGALTVFAIVVVLGVALLREALRRYHGTG